MHERQAPFTFRYTLHIKPGAPLPERKAAEVDFLNAVAGLLMEYGATGVNVDTIEETGSSKMVRLEAEGPFDAETFGQECPRLFRQVIRDSFPDLNFES